MINTCSHRNDGWNPLRSAPRALNLVSFSEPAWPVWVIGPFSFFRISFARASNRDPCSSLLNPNPQLSLGIKDPGIVHICHNASYSLFNFHCLHIHILLLFRRNGVILSLHLGGRFAQRAPCVVRCGGDDEELERLRCSHRVGWAPKELPPPQDRRAMEHSTARTSSGGSTCLVVAPLAELYHDFGQCLFLFHLVPSLALEYCHHL